MADDRLRGPRVGLRIDVDTLRGTQLGIPALLDVLAARGIRASIFFSVGPDNMGRHLWRLVRPKFLVKMLRSNAANLYGWSILARGVFWPGPHIGRRCARLMQSAAGQGHEIGIHGWDHHKWQARIDRMTEQELRDEIARGIDSLQKIIGRQLRCSASPGWRCNESVLALKENYGMKYHSDCRGTSIFRPVLRGVPGTPQIPVTLPTYDEAIGRNGITDDNYNAWLLSRIDPSALNVLTVHAEVEGIAKRPMFEHFLDDALQRGIRFVPLGEMLPDETDIAPGSIVDATVEGREGPVCVQAA